MREGETIEEYDERMGREAERDWNARNGRPRATGQELVIRREIAHPEPPAPGVSHPLDIAPVEFKRLLAVRGENRQALVGWLKDALIAGTDYGRIHYVKKATCDKGASCTNAAHFTKDVLFKPGAQKICGMLGVTPSYPNLARYEEAALAGVKITSIVLRCQILSVDGRVLAEGVGARALEQDYGDLNKSLKMAAKSAHLDATLSLAGLSEIFAHPDSPTDNRSEEPDPAQIPEGRNRGRLWAEASREYLQGVIDSPKASAAMRASARAELTRRPLPQEDFDDDIPF